MTSLMDACLFNDFPPLLCVEVDGKLFSLNNRRLYVARVLETQLEHSENFFIQVDIVEFGHPSVQRIRDGKTKWERAFSTEDGGLTVRVKSSFSGLELPCTWEEPVDEDIHDHEEAEWWQEYLDDPLTEMFDYYY